MHRLKVFPKMYRVELGEMDRAWMQACVERIRQYAFLRARGIPKQHCFGNAFGSENAEDNMLIMRQVRVESSPEYMQAYEQALKEVKTSEVWNEKFAIATLSELANAPFEKGTTRLAAAKELNVLVGITITDEKGNTRARPGLAEFYKDSENLKNPPPVPVGDSDGDQK